MKLSKNGLRTERGHVAPATNSSVADRKAKLRRRGSES
jgi:hypothetical protein